ncbi:putative XRE-type DNA-binding protein [Paraburkholderia sp. BL25I1N1]|nr:putative XRE-type DNA-binding protein [Paraburkholderia sp. BL25I1N1]
MSNRTFSSVWDAIEDTPEQAENMKLRSVLMMAIKDHIARTGMSQAEAAKCFCVTQPRVSDLIRGKINLFALDALVNMAVAADMRIEMRVLDGPVKRNSMDKTPARKRPVATAKKPAAVKKPRTKGSTRRSKPGAAVAAQVR